MQIDRRTVVIGTAAWAGLGSLAQAAEGDDFTIGAAAAPVHLIEYASLTCSHCAAFHEANWTTLKTNYIDTGRVRLTLREILTPPASVSLAMFQLARCDGADANEYFRRVAILFQRQRSIFESGSMTGVRDILVATGAQWGLSEAQVMAAVTDQAALERVQRVSDAANQIGVTGTPTFFLNGERVTDPAFNEQTGMTRILDAALNA
jgi:protein-disulfide isomerase